MSTLLLVWIIFNPVWNKPVCTKKQHWKRHWKTCRRSRYMTKTLPKALMLQKSREHHLNLVEKIFHSLRSISKTSKGGWWSQPDCGKQAGGFADVCFIFTPLTTNCLPLKIDDCKTTLRDWNGPYSGVMWVSGGGGRLDAAQNFVECQEFEDDEHVGEAHMMRNEDQVEHVRCYTYIIFI